MITYQFNEEAIKLDAQFLTPGDEVTFKSEVEGVDEINFDAKVRCADRMIPDIIEPEKVQSIQQDKLSTEEQLRIRKAEEKKESV